jgi:hypothetical protein
MVHKQPLLAAALAGLMLLGACSESRPPAKPAKSADSAGASASAAPAPASRPATMQGNLLLEGTPSSASFTLFESDAAQPLPGFSTYLPPDMVAEPGADELRFVAHFGGQRQAQAFLALRWLPPGTALADAPALIAAAAPGGAALQPVADGARRHGWSLAELGLAYQATGQGRRVGSILLGRHGERLFTLTLHYPVEYADGFMPRAQRMLDDWRWRDTGQGL